jgi:predicted PhzF superfamily epimerase YddE/YHI9
VPHNFHVHSQRIGINNIITTQPHIQIVPTIDKEKGRSFPLVSIVKGMTFALIDLTDNPEIFGALQGGKSPEAELDEKWKPSFVGAMYYRILARSEVEGEPAIHNISARMISHGIEDPGTGSACCALSCFLALGGDQASRVNSEKSQSSSEDAQQDASTTGKVEDDLSKKTADVKLAESKVERKVFGIQQGAEMGRLCTIAVEVDVKTDASGKQSIASVILSGRSMLMTRGELLGF